LCVPHENVKSRKLKMRDVLALKKPSPALRLCIQSAQLALSIKEVGSGY
jgi:hypothetical protein